MSSNDNDSLRSHFADRSSTAIITDEEVEEEEEMERGEMMRTPGPQDGFPPPFSLDSPYAEMLLRNKIIHGHSTESQVTWSLPTYETTQRNWMCYRTPMSEPPTLQKRSRINQLFPLHPPSPTPSEEITPPVSPNRTPTPPRSPIPEMIEFHPIPPPNSPIGGILESTLNLAEDNINMGLGWAQSWMADLKITREEKMSEERIILPTIFSGIHGRTLIMQVAHINDDKTLFHKVEVKHKTEKRMRAVLSKYFKVPLPFHRILLSVSPYAEQPLRQEFIDRFGPVEYFRLDTKRKNHWVLYHIINSSNESKK